jgi:hypothetical protein
LTAWLDGRGSIPKALCFAALLGCLVLGRYRSSGAGALDLVFPSPALALVLHRVLQASCGFCATASRREDRRMRAAALE